MNWNGGVTLAIIEVTDLTKVFGNDPQSVLTYLDQVGAKKKNIQRNAAYGRRKSGSFLRPTGRNLRHYGIVGKR